jgi:hypothetical protein
MLVAVVFGFLLFFLIWSLSGRRKGLPPGPTCYPIIGNVGVINPPEAVQGHRRLRKAYGDIYSLMIFHKSMIFVHGYDNIRELLLKHGDMFSDRPCVYPAEVIRKKKGILLAVYVCIVFFFLKAHCFLYLRFYKEYITGSKRRIK